MASLINLEAARQALAIGELARAESLAGHPGASDFDALAFKSEVLYFRGNFKPALELCETLLKRHEAEGRIRASLLLVAGACACELGDDASGLDRLEKAAALAKRTEDWTLLSRIHLQMLERSADSGTPYDLSLPLCATAVRAVHRSGDRSVLAEAHVTFARLEARAGAVDQATRHLRHLDRLLDQHPNRWLSASGRLTESILLSLQGDLQGACEAAASAGEASASIGWTKGEAIAAANLAFFYASLGRLDEGRLSLNRAEKTGYSTPSF
jgi:tetratricopeptide (TPR) repeat protein